MSDKGKDALVPSPKAAIEKISGVDQLLESIRPSWQSRSLIERVRKILPHDPSSACQRLFNAAIHDLREKVVIAGVDIAKDTAKSFNLPPIERAEDVEEYATARLLDLAYRMGLLTRPEWRRLQRAYEIRRDLEHEDDEYQAGPEDCIYIFKTTIEAVLSQDPIQLIRVTDIKELVEGTRPCAPSAELLTDYEHAPQPRQIAICEYLVSTALSTKQADLVRQKAVEMLRYLEPTTQAPVRLEIARSLQERIGRQGIDLAHAKVAHAIGALPYLKKVQLEDFFRAYMKKMDDVGYHWTKNEQHVKLLGDLEDLGGLKHCPEAVLSKMVSWLVLAYIGEPGGYGMGSSRPVFYSNSAAPIVKRLMEGPPAPIRKIVKEVASGRQVEAALANKHIQRRLEELLDLVEE
jgi:hypothetical protein